MSDLLSNFNLQTISSLSMLRPKYEVYQVENSGQQRELSNFGADFRAKYPEFKDSSLSILVKARESGKVVFGFTFFEINKENSYLTNFWNLNRKKSRLENINICELLGETSCSVLTQGFARCIEESSFELVLLYSEIFNTLLELFDGLSYLEVQGKCVINPELFDKQEIMLNRERPLIDEGVIGEVNDESRASLEFAELYSHVEIDRLFNIYTLGKVFFSESLVKRCCKSSKIDFNARV